MLNCSFFSKNDILPIITLKYNKIIKNNHYFTEIIKNIAILKC